MLKRLFLSSIFGLSLSLLLPAQETPSPEQGTVTTTGKFQPAETPPASGLVPKRELSGEFRVKELGADRVQIGKVIIDRSQRSISFPATVEVRDQNLEYLLVHETGKVHESLLSTPVPARDVHLAVILLAANGKSPKVEISWRKNGPDAVKPLTSLITQKEGAPKLGPGAWEYLGSSFDSRGFIAQREGSFIALIQDPAALIVHRLASGLGRDDVYLPNTKHLPALGVPVKVVLTF